MREGPRPLAGGRLDATPLRNAPQGARADLERLLHHGATRFAVACTGLLAVLAMACAEPGYGSRFPQPGDDTGEAGETGDTDRGDRAHPVLPPDDGDGDAESGHTDADTSPTDGDTATAGGDDTTDDGDKPTDQDGSSSSDSGDTGTDDGDEPDSTETVDPPLPPGPWCGNVRCPPAHTCVRLQCLPSCTVDEQCGDLAICEDGACAPTPCSDVVDCGYGEGCDEGICRPIGVIECAEDGTCGRDFFCATDGYCSVCADTIACPGELVCENRECVEQRVSPVRFRRLEVPGMERIMGWRSNDAMGFGAGFGLVDLDDNGRLDLFVGRYGPRDEPACLYRNLPDPDHALRFEPVEDCGGVDPDAWAAWPFDPDATGRDTMLIVMGDGFVHLHDLAGDEPVQVLAHPRLERDLIERCVPGAVAPIDLTFDGVPELVIGCQAHENNLDEPELLDWTNLIFHRNDAGDWMIWEDPAHDLMRNDGTTLAFGLLDYSGNGLLDVAMANDTYSTINYRNLNFNPGAFFARCAPDEDCVWSPHPWATNTTAWGAYMGVGHVRTLGHSWIYLADWGPNRLVRFGSAGAIDQARQLGIDLGRTVGRNQFAWGVLVDDFTGNGQDDIIVTHGMTADIDEAIFAAHVDTLLIQEEDGLFSAWTHEAGFVPPDEEPTDLDGLPAGSRNAAKADLTGDGRLEIIIASLNGPLKIYTEDFSPGAPHPRCTIRPVSRLVPSTGFGFGLADTEGGEFVVRDIQGQMRAGLPSSIVSPWNAGRIRFPSGFTMPFDCEGGVGPIRLVEPDWLQVVASSGQIEITFDPPPYAGISAVSAILRDQDGAMQRVDGVPAGENTWLLDGDATAIFPRIDGRWTGRWLDASP